MPRAPVYRAEFAEQAHKLCLLLGATDEEIGEFFEVSARSIRTWKTKYPEFAEAVRAGKTVANMNVAHSLYRQAIGFEYEEEQAFTVRTGQHTTEVKVVKIKRFAPAAALPGIYFLNNRERDKWRQKVDHEVAGKDGSNLIVEIVRFDPSAVT